MATNLTERVSKLTARIDRLDETIEAATANRQAAIEEIQSLLGLTAVKKTAPVTEATATKPRRKPKQYNAKQGLGDAILSIMSNFPGQTAEFYAKQVRSTTQAVALALYHLRNKGKVYEADNHYYMNAVPMMASTEPVVSE